MSTLFDYLKQTFTEPKPAGAPHATAPISVQNAYQSSQRTGAPSTIPTQAQINQITAPQTPQPDVQPESDTAYVQGDTFTFPADTYEAKRQEGLNRKAAAIGLVNQLVQTYEPSEREYQHKSLMSQIDAELAAQKYEVDDFLKKRPAIEAFGKELLNDNTKRSAVSTALASQLQAIDRPLKKGENPEDHAASIIRQLQGPWLKTTNGIMGTSDAVAENEADRLMGGANGKWLNLSNAFKQGLSVTEKPTQQLERYKVVLADAMNSMMNQSNASFNKLALQSNPEIAQDYLGQEVIRPYSGKTIQPLTGVQPRISRQAPTIQDATAPEQRAVRVRTFGPNGTLVDKP
jgi:hypothetical protein